MKLIAGSLLLIISLFGVIYFKSYKGTIIPYPVLWFIGFIALGFLGSWLIYTSLSRTRKIVEDHINTELEGFKSRSEKIELDFDKCEFKSGSFSHEIEDPKFTAIKHLVPNSAAYAFDTTITENVIRSYLVYTNNISPKPNRYVSQSFPFDETMLKYYVINKKITLYIDRFNKQKYFFELKM